MNLPEWADGMEPTITHGDWEIDPTVDPIKQLVAIEVSGGILSAYVSKYEERLVYTYRRSHTEIWTRPGHYILSSSSDWENGAWTDVVTFKRTYQNRETWGRKTWERKDCGQ